MPAKKKAKPKKVVKKKAAKKTSKSKKKVSKEKPSPLVKKENKPLKKLPDVKLSPIEQKLLGLANENKSVLIYGKDTIGRYELIRRTHLKKRGKEDLFGMMKAKLKDITRNKNQEELHKLLRDFRSTDNTYNYFDFNVVDANKFLEIMSEDKSFTQEEVIDKISSMIKRERHWEDFCIDLFDYEDDLGQPYSSTTSYLKKRLLARKGTLFVNNLRCDSSNSESYKRLAMPIEKDRGLPSREYLCTGDKGWFVVYTRDDLKEFPDYFREQFVEVALEQGEASYEATAGGSNQEETRAIENEEVVTVDSAHRLLTYKEEDEKLEPIQIQLLELLYGDKDNLVTRNRILKRLWGGVIVYEKQITDHISKIRKALKGLGFEEEVVKKEMIETIRKSSATSGGYKFHSNLITLCFR